MKRDNDNNFKKLFENDGIVLPESLSKENMIKKINEENIEQKKKKIKIFPKLAAAAAAAAVIITCVSVFPRDTSFHTSPVNESTVFDQENIAESAQEGGILKAQQLSKFDSDEDVKAYFNSIYQDHKKTLFDYAFQGIVDEAAPATAVNSAASKSTDDSFRDSASNYGKTNTQVASVDEADIIKNDGRYIYVANSDCFSIIDTTTMEKVYESNLKPDDKKHGYSFSEMYVSNNRLVITGGEYEKYDSDGNYPVAKYNYYDCIYPINRDIRTVSFVFDITDKANPVLTRALTQDGSVVSSRMVGSVLYTVTRYFVDVSDKKEIDEKYAPSVNGEKMPCDEIFIKDSKDNSTAYIVLTAYDTADANGKVGKVSLLGECDEVYCSTDTLYVACADYSWTNGNPNNGINRTELFAFSLDGAKVAFKTSGAVPGTLDDQYSMDEHNSYFRITTTDYDYSKDVDISSLYVLNSNLEIVGQLQNFAKDEQVKSTRFMGNTAYVVTFRNTDPLFAIDLSDPQNPVVTGSLKIPGFSEYLHPISDKLLVGLGYNGDEDSADMGCIKVSLFDVSNPKKPKELDTHIISEASTEASYNAKAFVFDSQRNIFGFPVSYELYGKNGEYNGYVHVFKTICVKDNKLTDEKGFVHQTYDYRNNARYHYPQFFRGTYIGNSIYTLNDTVIKEFDLESGSVINSLEYHEVEEPENEITGTTGIVIVN